MARPSQFRAKRGYESRMGSKANKNLEVMAVVGNGDGTTYEVANRDSFYWIRLVNDDDRLTQCFCDICALSYGDMIFVARAKDEKLSYYEFVRFIQNADGDTTDPPVCPKFAQVVYVSENACQFNTVGAAVTYIGALVTGPAAGRLFLIKVQAGNYAETGDVTIPQYVHLEGVGEASELEMGVNTLILSSDTSVSNIVVESSDPADAIRCNGVTNVLLRNVRGIQSDAADVFHVYGASIVEMYNCIAQATVGNAVGFHVGDTSVVYMDYCKAEDSTNFADALLLDAALCAAITRWCTFVGNGDDVQTGANSVWYHLDCHFYLTNCTLVAGTHYTDPTKRFNQTLIVAEYGGEFQALSEAITYIGGQGDAAAGKLYGVLMLHGNFAETGDVTVPQYVHVKGMGEGTEIEMGANTLIMSSDTSLQDVIVESSDTTDAIRLNGVSNVTLRNVRCIQGASADCFHILGLSTDVQLTNCFADTYAGGVGFHIEGTGRDINLYVCHALAISAYNAATYGFQIGGTVHANLDYCGAEDGNTYSFADGLHLDNSACTARTRWCTFWTTDDDVNQGAAATWNSYKDRVDPLNCTLAGTVDMQDINAGNSFAFAVKNTSGGAAAAADVGYIDEAGEYQTTTTQYHDVNWCVVVVPGPNNADIWVARRGRVTVQLDANCAVGDYLYTSGTATQATPQSYTRPELFAVALTANAAGAGGTCQALLLCHTKFVPMTSDISLMYVSLADPSDYRATIAGLPGGAVLNMNAPISGNINTIDPQAANYLAKFRLYNEVDGDYALIDDVTGAAQITLTANVPAGWAVGETLTARSQTCVFPGAPPYMYELDLSDADNTVVPVLARAICVNDWGWCDTGAGNIRCWIHPWTAYAGSRLLTMRSVAANWWNYRYAVVPLYQRRYCAMWDANGAGTARWEHRLGGWFEAAP